MEQTDCSIFTGSVSRKKLHRLSRWNRQTVPFFRQCKQEEITPPVKMEQTDCSIFTGCVSRKNLNGL